MSKWKMIWRFEIIVPNHPDADSVLDFLEQVKAEAEDATEKDVEIVEVKPLCPECGSQNLAFGPRGYICRACMVEFRKDLGTYKEPVMP